MNDYDLGYKEGFEAAWEEAKEIYGVIHTLASAKAAQEGAGAGAVEDSSAVDLLDLLAHAYRPQWLGGDIKGYGCAYCGAIIREGANTERPSHHSESCVWIRARAWLMALDKRQRPSAAQANE